MHVAVCRVDHYDGSGVPRGSTVHIPPGPDPHRIPFVSGEPGWVGQLNNSRCPAKADGPVGILLPNLRLLTFSPAHSLRSC